MVRGYRGDPDLGRLSLASVLDVLSRTVVGWSMRDDMEAELVVDALEMALSRRRTAPGLIHHPDQGSQEVVLVFGQRFHTERRSSPYSVSRSATSRSSTRRSTSVREASSKLPTRRL